MVEHLVTGRNLGAEPRRQELSSTVDGVPRQWEQLHDCDTMSRAVFGVDEIPRHWKQPCSCDTTTSLSSAGSQIHLEWKLQPKFVLFIRRRCLIGLHLTCSFWFVNESAQITWISRQRRAGCKMTNLKLKIASMNTLRNVTVKGRENDIFFVEVS